MKDHPLAFYSLSCLHAFCDTSRYSAGDRSRTQSHEEYRHTQELAGYTLSNLSYGPTRRIQFRVVFAFAKWAVTLHQVACRMTRINFNLFNLFHLSYESNVTNISIAVFDGS